MDNANKELILERELDASKEAVFNAWIDPEIVKEWWGPNGVSNDVVAWNAVPGGKIELTMVAGEELGEMAGQRWPMRGEFLEIDEPNKIVFKGNAVVDDKIILENLNTVTFEENNGKTKMVVNIKVTKAVMPEAQGPLMGMEMGWNQQLDKLVELSKTLKA